MNDLGNVHPFSRDGKKDDGLPDLSGFANAPTPVSPDFVARVMRGLPGEPVRRQWAPELWKWAAALLIFSAAVGYGFSIAEQTADSVASLTSTSDTDSSLLNTL